MEGLPDDWFALLALVFALGLKHGLDADHLATIDGLTRHNARHDLRLARRCGLLFSLGHGAVVIAIALAVGALSTRWQTPHWLEDVGAWVSVGFLTLLGAANLRAVLSAPGHLPVHPVGIKGRFLGRLQRARNPLLVAAVGALFALSFDTVSQASLFALAATRYGGWGHALALGLAFMLGMTLADSANGLWISRLLARADQLALVASRVMGLTVAGISLLVAAFGAARYWVPSVEAWGEGKELALGTGVIIVLGASFVLAFRLTRVAAVRPAQPTA
jgi:nickel/cobalt transporter (NiCoT) family protein